MRRSKIQTRQYPSVVDCGIFYLQNIVSVFVYNIMWSGIQCFHCYILSVVSKKQNNANSPCIIGNCLLFLNLFTVIPVQRAQQTAYHLMSQCCRLLPRNPREVTVPLLCSFMSSYITEIGTDVDWLL